MTVQVVSHNAETFKRDLAFMDGTVRTVFGWQCLTCDVESTSHLKNPDEAQEAMRRHVEETRQIVTDAVKPKPKPPRKCTVCIYREHLEDAVTSFTMPTTKPDFVGAPTWYCARHVESMPAQTFVLNAARHAYDWGDDPDMDLPAELLGALLDV